MELNDLGATTVIAASQEVALSVEHVRAYFDFQSPPLQKPSPVRYLLAVWWTRR
jgi:hypothetical protein